MYLKSLSSKNLIWGKKTIYIVFRITGNEIKLIPTFVRHFYLFISFIYFFKTMIIINNIFLLFLSHKINTFRI